MINLQVRLCGHCCLQALVRTKKKKKTQQETKERVIWGQASVLGPGAPV